MKLENQVCTIEQAKRLKELGIEGKQCYWEWWFTPILTRDGMDSTTILRSILNDPTSPSTETYPAFTVAELGAMLPSHNSSWYGNTAFGYMGWIVDSMSEPMDWGTITAFDTEAQARADKLIYLLENNLTTATDCNNRLNSSI